VVENGINVSLANRLGVWVNSPSEISYGTEPQPQKHFGEFLVWKKLPIAAIFTMFL